LLHMLLNLTYRYIIILHSTNQISVMIKIKNSQMNNIKFQLYLSLSAFMNCIQKHHSFKLAKVKSKNTTVQKLHITEKSTFIKLLYAERQLTLRVIRKLCDALQTLLISPKKE